MRSASRFVDFCTPSARVTFSLEVKPVLTQRTRSGAEAVKH